MKKWLSLLLVVALTLALLAGCGRDKNDNQPAQDSPEAQENQPVQNPQDTQQAVTPGQSAVAYDGDTVLGGGELA